MKPYWQSADGALTVYHARWEAVHAAGLVPVEEVSLVHGDPPYGGGDLAVLRNDTTSARSKRAKVWKPIVGDDRPYDPAPLLALSRPTVLWGANHYSDRVPGSPSWILWDKRPDIVSDMQADGELAWSNLGGPLRTFRHVWRHFVRGPETGSHIHPTQKPIALCSFVYGRAKLKRGDLVFVPYLGSGPDLPAAQAMGLRLIACEVEREYCDTAIGRLGAITAERAAEPCGPLFRLKEKP